jgi:hypothetical protein
VKELEDKLMAMEQHEVEMMKQKSGGKDIRIWMDGAFDMMHYGV